MYVNFNEVRMNKIDELIKHVKDADAIVVGAGSGMSRAKRCIEVT